MDREPAELGDPAALVLDAEAHHAGRLAVDLDHEAAEVLRLALRARDLLEQLLARGRTAGGQVRVDVLVRRQLDEEVDVGRRRPTDRDTHGRAGSTASRLAPPA